MPNIPDLFATATARFPGNTALEADGRTTTYTELHDQALRMAAYLRSAMTPSSGRVGLEAVKTTSTYVAYLALLRLGLTVVPIGADSPPARIDTVADEAGLDVVLTHTDHGSGLAVPTLPLATAMNEAARFAPLSGRCDAVSQTEAYVLFTSGSTGVPKGIPITHGNVVSYLDHVIAESGLTGGSRVSHTFSLTFDPSVYDMLATWAAGATLVVPSGHDLIRPGVYVARERLTHWFSVPSVVALAGRANGLPAGSMPTLRWSGFIGEPLTLAQAYAWQQAAPGSVIENVYGPTELTVACTGYRLPADPADWPRTPNDTVPIGSLYPRLEQLLVDADGRIADRGELCVRGAQRFSGYVRESDNTHRFYRTGADSLAVAIDRLTRADDDLWYRTGDVVEIRDGVMVHIGRLDRQLKVRGYRIEPEEIESALRKHPAVTDAVITTSPGSGGLSLVAFVIGDRGDEAALRTHLASGLPRHLMPSRIVWVDELPTNARGKVDHKRLAAIAGAPASVNAGAPAAT